MTLQVFPEEVVVLLRHQRGHFHGGLFFIQLAACFMIAIKGKHQTLSDSFRNVYGFLIGQLRIKHTVIIPGTWDIMESILYPCLQAWALGQVSVANTFPSM